MGLNRALGRLLATAGSSRRSFSTPYWRLGRAMGKSLLGCPLPPLVVRPQVAQPLLAVRGENHTSIPALTPDPQLAEVNARQPSSPKSSAVLDSRDPTSLRLPRLHRCFGKTPAKLPRDSPTIEHRHTSKSVRLCRDDKTLSQDAPGIP